MHTIPATQPAAPTAPAPAGPPQAQVPTVHRSPVATLDGRVVGYSVTVSLAPSVPTQGPTGPLHDVHDHYLALDLPNLVANRFVFLPATPQMLDGFVPTPVVPGRLVLDLPLRFEYTPDAVQRALALRALGVQLALLGYRGEPEQEALLPHVGFVVVDPNEPELPLARLVHHVHATGARVLAERPQDEAVEAECRTAGVDGVRGGYEERSGTDPEAPGQTRVLRAGELQCVGLLHALAQEDVDLGAVAQVVDTDPVLTLRVLHLVNSGAFALTHQVDTVQQAVVLLGRRQLMTLVSALVVDARPDAMDSLWFILARALTCETLADDSTGYTVGMLSALAAHLGVPPAALVESVGVSQAVADAVREETGPFGPLLAAVRSHERGDTAGVLAAGLLPAEVSSVYMRSVATALETARAVTRDAIA